MKNFRTLLVLILLAGCGLLTGCKIRVVNRPAPTPVPTPVPYPYALQIETRVQEQLTRIAGYLQGGNLVREQADVLTDNTLLVRRFSAEFRGPSSQKRDLTYQQATLLNNMLDDNARFIDDALKRRQYWVHYFQGGSYNYTTVSSRYVYIAYLDLQLKRQLSDVEAGMKSRRLSSIRARELRGRIKAVSDLKLYCYRVNGRMDLSEDQVRQLSQMAEDNANYIAFCLKKGKGRWNNARFNGWKKRKPQGLGQGQTGNWGNSGSNELPKAIPTSTPLPIPTFTPVPVPQALTATPTPMAVAAPTPTPAPEKVQLDLLPPGQLVSFLKHLDNAVEKAGRSKLLSEAQAAVLETKLATLHRKADGYQEQNQAKSVTREQMDRLEQMGGEIDQFIEKALAGAPSDKPKKDGEDPKDKKENGSDKDKEKDHGRKDDAGKPDEKDDAKKPKDDDKDPKKDGKDDEAKKKDGEDDGDKKDGEKDAKVEKKSDEDKDQAGKDDDKKKNDSDDPDPKKVKKGSKGKKKGHDKDGD